MKLLCLHGFLGTPRDFNFLKKDYDIITPNLANYVHLAFENLLEIFKEKYSLDTVNILGYSFGARLGARLFLEQKGPPSSKLICLGGHLGLKTVAERSLRYDFERKMVSDLQSLPSEAFLKNWNSYDIFKRDKDKLDPDFRQAEFFFTNYGLSKQPYLRDLIFEKRERCSFYYGSCDLKYTDYAKGNLQDFNVNSLEGLGHRLLDHEERVKKIIRSFI